MNISRLVIGCAMGVHRELGCGYLELVYERALEIELKSKDIRVERQVSLPVSYKGNLARILHQYRGCWRPTAGMQEVEQCREQLPRTGAAGRRAGPRTIAVAMVRGKTKSRRSWASQGRDRIRAGYKLYF